MEHLLKPARGSRTRRRRVGRGDSGRRGSSSGRGMKGQKSRSGKGPRPGFEGGQLPLVKKLPTKRGFVNIFRTEYTIVNLKKLEVFPEGSEVTLGRMREAGLIGSVKGPVKVLGDGDLSKPLTVQAHRFSREARRKIEAAGGRVQEL